MKKIFLFIISLIIIIFLATTSFSANIDTYGIGSKATALGGAYTAYADDVFAVYYNPAGLTQLNMKQIALGTHVIDPKLEGKNFLVEKSGSTLAGPVDFEDESNVLIVPHIGFAMPINEKMAFGIAAYVPFGLHIKWDDTANLYLNPASYNCYEAAYAREVVTPTIAYKINENLSVGFGISLGKAESWSYLNAYNLLPLTVKEKVELSDNFNYSFNFGVMYKPTKELTLGLTYRSFTNVDFEGDLKLTDIDDSERILLQAQGLTKFKTDVAVDDVHLPNQIQFGVRYTPTEKLSIEADIVWTQWSMVDYQTLEIKDPIFQAALGGKELKVKRDWKDTNQVKIGLEYKATDILTLRIGYFYDPTPIPQDTFDMVWPDADKKTYSLGAGINLGNWVIDGVLQYTITEKDTVIGGESVNLNESYGEDAKVKTKAQGQLWGFGLTVTYNF